MEGLMTTLAMILLHQVLTASTASSVGADTFDIRRARIGIKYKFGKYYSGEVTANTVGTSSDVLDVGYLDVAWFEQAKFRFGQFKMPFSLEQLTSSNNIGFIERSFVDSFHSCKRERPTRYLVSQSQELYLRACNASNGTTCYRFFNNRRRG